MTIEQVLSKYPSTKKDGWKQYKNSNGTLGGWVHKDAVVKPIYPLFIGEEAVIRGGDIRGGDIRGGYIRGGDISGGDISGGYISGGDISGGDISGGYISGGDISGGYISGGDISGGYISGGDISGGYISGGDISGGDISGGDISGGDISGGDISGGDISGGYISGGDISGGYISGGDISGGDIRGGDISGGAFNNPNLIWHETPVQLVGRKWVTHQSDIDKVRCGCEEHTFKEWKDPKFMSRIFRGNSLNAADVREYKAAILYCIAMAKFTKVELKKK